MTARRIQVWGVMAVVLSQPRRLPVGSVVGGVLLPSALFLYVWLAVDTRLMYFWPIEFFPVHRLGWAFASDFLGRVGGPAEYAAAFLSQLYYYRWLGALVLTLMAAALCGAAWLYLSAIGRRRPRFLHYVPALLVLALANRYAHHLDAVLAVLVAALAAPAYLKVSRRVRWPSALAFLALSAVVHYVAGGAFLLFAVLCALGELAAGRHEMAAFCVACGGVLPYVTAGWILPTRLRFAYGRLLPFGPDRDTNGRWLMVALYAYWPVAGIGAAVRRLLRGPGEAGTAEASAPRFWTGRPCLRWALGTAAVFMAGLAAAWLSWDGKERALRQIELCSRTGQWEQLLELAAGLRPESYDLGVSWDVNRALYHTGQLPHRMFSYPQHVLGLLPNTQVFPQPAEQEGASLEFSDAFMDLGYVNAGELLAYQALEVLGQHPYILQRVALTALAREQMAAARVLLNALSRDLVYGAWARVLLAEMRADPSSGGQAEIQRLRAIMPVEDFVGLLGYDELLPRLLARNPRNRAAFEYLMAHLMLTGQLGWLAEHLKGLDEVAYPQIPAHYEEALLIYEDATGQPLDLGGRSISAASRRRFEVFQSARRAYGRDRRAAAQALAGEFGNSYFFYNAFKMGR